jgi:hypothetical protein
MQTPIGAAMLLFLIQVAQGRGWGVSGAGRLKEKRAS